MSILKEIKRLFGVKGASIEEALKNVDSIGGGSGGGSVVMIEAQTADDFSTLTKTASEIKQIANSGKAIIIYEKVNDIQPHTDYLTVVRVAEGIVGGAGCEIKALDASGNSTSIRSFVCGLDDDYPKVRTEG